jgi:superoxide reductase
MTKKLQIYKCETCGNIIEVVGAGDGDLVCCGEPMVRLDEKTKDELKEKHVPVVEIVDTCSYLSKAGTDLKQPTMAYVNPQHNCRYRVHVKIGDVPHPMEEDHYIEWIELITETQTCKKFLKPHDAPEAAFQVTEMPIKVREHCNVHGLWANSDI